MGETKYTREQLIAALTAEYELLYKELDLEDFQSISEYAEALQAMPYERLLVETGADNTLNSLDEYMSRHLT